MTPISAEAQDAIAQAVKEYPERWKGGVCAFTLIDRQSGAQVGGSPVNGACHAAISYGYGIRKGKDVIVVNAHRPKWAETNPDFLLWVAREAPFSHGVLNRDNEKELFNHADVIDMEATGQAGALWLCKAFRHFTEDTWTLKRWSQLREEGLTGLQAFIGADILDASGNPTYGCTHVGLFSYKTPTALRKDYDFFRNAKKLDGGTACRSGGWDVRPGIWGSLVGKKVKKPDGWGGFIEITQPCDVKEYAAKLKEIFEGDPKNVK